LFAHGWKDSACFYGCGESYVTSQFGARERSLLKWSECCVRGLQSAAPLEETKTEEEYDEFHPSFERTDEEAFLPAFVPSSLSSLSFHFNRAAGNLYSPRLIENVAMNRRKEDRFAMASKILRGYIFVRGKHTRLCLSATIRSVDPLLVGRLNRLDLGIVLDYLPMLRCMSALERQADLIFNAIQDADPNVAFDMAHRQRSTRRSRTRGREHYFEKVVPSFAWAESGAAIMARELGSTLADVLLVTCLH
jgi:hypothetical protein